QQLAQRLAGTVPADCVHLSTPVTEIDTSGRIARIRTASGDHHEADDVVLAVPASVWEKIRFVPALPACLSPQMGNNIKYVAGLTHRYWKERAINALSDGPLGSSWEQTDDLPGCNAAIVSALPSCCAADAVRQLSEKERLECLRHSFEEIVPGFQEH